MMRPHPSPSMATIFVSYSRKDERWKSRLLDHLGVVDQLGLFECWHDCLINPGTDWKQEIETALNRARVAILLVSRHFLTSQFVRSEEIPVILARRQREELLVIPVIVSPCLWQEIPWLASIQARPRNGRSLQRMRPAMADEELTALAEDILRHFSAGSGSSDQRQRGVARVLIVDDHPLFREGLRKEIERSGDLSVVGEAGTAEETLRLAKIARPDVVLLDLELPDRGGVAILGDLKSLLPCVRILIVTHYREASLAIECLRTGADGFLTKSEGRESAISAIHKVVSGGRYISPDLATGRRRGELTDRETEVLNLLVDGMENEAVAATLGISVRAVKMRQKRISRKMINIADLVRFLRTHR
jgi:DNA-binding NarL/FixJ family response regulator